MVWVQPGVGQADDGELLLCSRRGLQLLERDEGLGRQSWRRRIVSPRSAQATSQRPSSRAMAPLFRAASSSRPRCPRQLRRPSAACDRLLGSMTELSATRDTVPGVRVRCFSLIFFALRPRVFFALLPLAAFLCCKPHAFFHNSVSAAIVHTGDALQRIAQVKEESQTQLPAGLRGNGDALLRGPPRRRLRAAAPRRPSSSTGCSCVQRSRL